MLKALARTVKAKHGRFCAANLLVPPRDSEGFDATHPAKTILAIVDSGASHNLVDATLAKAKGGRIDPEGEKLQFTKAASDEFETVARATRAGLNVAAAGELESPDC